MLWRFFLRCGSDAQAGCLMLYYGAEVESKGQADGLGITLSELFKAVEKRAEGLRRDAGNRER